MTNRVILSAGIARRLLKRGHIISSVEPNKTDSAKTVFVFFVDDSLNADIDDIMKSQGNDCAAIKQRLQALNLTEKQYKASIFKQYLHTI